jgi:hypothetical protein
MRRLTLCDVSGISQTLVVCVNIALGVLPHLVSPSLALQSSMLTPSNPLVMPSQCYPFWGHSELTIMP